MQGDIQVLLVATLALGSALGEGLCKHRHSWWDRQRGECVPCTFCNSSDHLVVKFPCETYRDTVCQLISDIQLTVRRNEIKYSESEYEYYDSSDYSDTSVSESEVRWDYEATTLTLAVSGCVVFFVVVLFLWLYHAKQWRVIKQALKSDVQDLSAKLKLMEAGEAQVEPVVSTDHHIYCNIHVGKDALLGPTIKGLGNVYTQDKH